MPLYQFRYFFEWGSDDCLWPSNDAAREQYGYPTSCAELPLSSEIISELKSLAAEFQSALNWEYPPDPSPWSDTHKAEFLSRSKCVYDRLIQELGKDFLIQYEVFLPD